MLSAQLARDNPQTSAATARLWLVMLLCLGVVCTTGCSGCSKQSTSQQVGQSNSTDGDGDEEKTAEEQLEERKQKLEAQKKKKPDFEIGQLVPQFSPLVSDLEEELPRRLFKPGHWTSTIQPMKANYEDFVGRSTIQLVDENNEPLTIDSTPFTLSFSRPVLLAKGRKKYVEGEILVPDDAVKPRVDWTLQRRDSLRDVLQESSLPLSKMPSYQYFFAVLAKEPGRYGFLKVTDAVRAPWEGEDGVPSDRHYQVLLVDATEQLPLSANVLTWTSLAYLVWDEVDPTRLSPLQQQALVDWLHWGGRLIINGPDSLDTLRDSFLDPYLPADSEGSWSVTAATLQPWNEYWTQRTEGKNVAPLVPTTPWSAVRLRLRAGASEVVGTAKLFYERSVGHGSVLVSAMQLTQRDLVNWPGFDCFLNAAILKRPRRKFVEGPYGGMQTNWADYGNGRLDAHFITGLRYFARDAATKANWRRDASVDSPQNSRPNSQGIIGNVVGGVLGSGAGGEDDSMFRTVVDRPGGLGAWSDFSPVSNAAREVLSDAAAVRVPGASFVVVCLAVYLMVLVPLNWIVFHTLQRVEWAWIAAPVIALLATYMVVRLAQLDIGFVRSQTEIGVLELAGDYPRGHLSRYTALYTSLSTTYDLKFDDQSAVATPFPVRQNAPTVPGRSIIPVTFEKRKVSQLQGLAVSSATTNIVHSEQMIALDGPIRVGKSSQGLEQVENHTGLDLKDVMLIRRTIGTDDMVDTDGMGDTDDIGSSKKQQLKYCWMGDLRSGNSSILNFQSVVIPEDGLPYTAERKQATLTDFEDRMDLDPLLKIAMQFELTTDPYYGCRDQYRLLARIDQVLPGTAVSPAASQIRGTALIVANLRFGPMPKPRPDVNTRKDVTAK